MLPNNIIQLQQATPLTCQTIFIKATDPAQNTTEDDWASHIDVLSKSQLAQLLKEALASARKETSSKSTLTLFTPISKEQQDSMASEEKHDDVRPTF